MNISRKLQLLFCLCGVLMMISQTWGQTQSQNYVKSFNASKAITGELKGVNNKDSVMEVTQYFDGLGREMQTVMRENSPDSMDMITIQLYDDFGRKTIAHLPYEATTTSGAYHPSALSEQATFYQNLFGSVDGPFGFSKSVLESSELNRTIKQGSPGGAWQPDGNNSYASTDHTVKFGYEFNATNEVLLISYDLQTGLIHCKDGSGFIYYDAATLFKNLTKDEGNHEVIQFVDKEGKTILKRVESGTNQSTGLKEYADTYYIFDEYGNLAVVLPPEAVKEIMNQN